MVRLDGVCFLIALNTKIETLNVTIQREIAGDIALYENIMRVYSDIKNANDQDVAPTPLLTYLRRCFQAGRFPDAAACQGFVLFLELSSAQADGICFANEQLDDLLAMYRNEKPADGNLEESLELFREIVEFIRKYQAMREVGDCEVDKARFTPVFHRRAIASVSDLHLLFKLSVDLLELVGVMPPAMMHDCVNYIAIKTDSQSVVVSFEANKFIDSNNSELQAVAKAVKKSLGRDRTEDIRKVICVASIILQCIAPGLICVTSGKELEGIKRLAYGNAITGQLAKMLFQASQGGMGLKAFEEKLESSCQEIQRRLEFDDLWNSFVGTEAGASTAAGPGSEKACAKGGHKNFGDALLGRCRKCALKFWLARDVQLTDAALVKLLNDKDPKAAATILQLLRDSGIIDHDVHQEKAVLEGLLSNECGTETSRALPDEHVGSPGETACIAIQSNGTAQKVVRDLFGDAESCLSETAQRSAQDSQDIEAHALRPAQIHKDVFSDEAVIELAAGNPCLGEPPVRSGNVAVLQKADEQRPETLLEEPVEVLITQQEKDIAELNEQLRAVLRSEHLHDKSEWLKVCAVEEGNTLAEHSHNLVRYFVPRYTPGNGYDHLPHLSRSELQALMDQVLAAVQKLETPEEFRQQAVDDISTAALWAVFGLGDSIFDCKEIEKRLTKDSKFRNQIAQIKKRYKQPEKRIAVYFQRFRDPIRKEIIRCMQDILTPIWKIFLALGKTKISRPLCLLSAKMIKEKLDHLNQLQVHVELWETFRTVQLWTGTGQQNRELRLADAQQGAPAGAPDPSRFAFVLPVSTNDILRYAMAIVLGDYTSRFDELVKRFSDMSAENRAEKQKLLQNVFASICVRYGCDMTQLSDEQMALCKPHVDECLDGVPESMLNKLRRLDFKTPSLELQDSIPFWDYLKLTIKFAEGNFTLTACEMFQFKARFRAYGFDFDPWKCLSKKEQVQRFCDSDVYKKLVKAFELYSPLFNEGTQLVAYAEYFTRARFEFEWTVALKLSGLEMPCLFRCYNMFEPEDLPEIEPEDELDRMYLIHPGVLNKYLNGRDTGTLRADLKKQLVGFSGQVIVPFLGTKPQTFEVKFDGGSFTLIAWPLPGVVEHCENGFLQCTADKQTSSTLESWKKAADEFFITRIKQLVNYGDTDQLEKLSLGEIFRAFICAFLSKYSCSPFDFMVNGTQSAFQLYLVRAFVPRLIQDKASLLHKVFKIDEVNRLSSTHALLAAFLEVVKNAGDQNSCGEARVLLESICEAFPPE